MKHKKHRKLTLRRRWQRFEFKHTVLAIVCITAFVLLLDTTIVQGFLNEITSLGYLGIFLSGVMFVSFFTAAPAIVLLAAFTQEYNIAVVATVAGLGAMLGDWLILRFAEDQIARELKPIARRLKLLSFINLLHRKKFKPVTATVGAIVVASPLPDEAGIALLGLSHISTGQLLGVTYVLNAAGIGALLVAFT